MKRRTTSTNLGRPLASWGGEIRRTFPTWLSHWHSRRMGSGRRIEASSRSEASPCTGRPTSFTSYGKAQEASNRTRDVDWEPGLEHAIPLADEPDGDWEATRASLLPVGSIPFLPEKWDSLGPAEDVQPILVRPEQPSQVHRSNRRVRFRDFPRCGGHRRSPWCGTGSCIVRDVHPRDQWTWEGAGHAALMGAISGAIFAAVLYALAPASGIGFFAAGFLAGVAAHNVETMVEYTLTGTYSWTPWRMLVAGDFGGALAAMFYFAGRFL